VGGWVGARGEWVCMHAVLSLLTMLRERVCMGESVCVSGCERVCAVEREKVGMGGREWVGGWVGGSVFACIRC